MIKAVSLILNVTLSLGLLGCEGNVDLAAVRNANTNKQSPLKYRPGAKIVVEPKEGETAVSYPVSLLDPALVCTNVTFYNKDGEVVQGTRICDGSPLLGLDPNLKAENIKAGISIGKIVGTLRARPEDCGSDGSMDCVVIGPTYAAAITSNIAAKVVSGQSVAGILGSATPPLPNCSADGQTNCVAISSYPALQLSLLTPGVLKSGTVINSVTGAYPNATYPLAAGDAYVDLDAATFNAKVKASANFGWFDRNGTRYSAVGDTDITSANIKSGIDIFNSNGNFGGNCTADGQLGCLTNGPYRSVDTSALSTWDIRAGKTAGAISGSLSFYKNLAQLTTFNRTTGTDSNASTTVADIYDTIDDYNSAGAMPSQVPTGFTAPGSNWLRDSLSDSNANGTCDGSEACVYKDLTTGLLWAKDDTSTYTWENAISYCAGLNYGSYTGWRLPTQKELTQSYINGIWAQNTPLSLSSNYYWSSSTRSNFTTNAWVVYQSLGSVNYAPNSNYFRVLCVR
ncbi:MAG: DUF1566 domain-containing protein [Oligoflexus sp.]|nr:DUF1566 domain-containing protein [Oligoflexus sp.]